MEKALPGFGEAFRTLLFDHIGTGIVAVRTTAGVAKSTPVFCLPGDPEAAALGVEEIVAPEAGELVAHLTRVARSGRTTAVLSVASILCPWRPFTPRGPRSPRSAWGPGS
ncbi:molybdenum cofactor biosynthesis protein B [Halomicroarcula sp. GCM10025710]